MTIRKASIGAFGAIIILFAISGAVQASIILWVATDDSLDQGYTDYLTSAAGGGHAVTRNHTLPSGNDFKGVLTQAEKDSLDNDFDLIIASRHASTSTYNDPDGWNGTTTPILLLNAFISRNICWDWFKTDSETDSNLHHMRAVDASDDAFAGMGLSNGDALYVADHANLPKANDPRSGDLIARLDNPSYPRIWIARWTGDESLFYAETDQGPGGQRVFFGAPSSWDDLTDNGKTVFDNLVNSLLPTIEVVPEPSALAMWLIALVSLAVFCWRKRRAA